MMTDEGPKEAVRERVKEARDDERKALSFYREAVAELDPGTRGATHYRIKEWKPIYTKILVLTQRGMTVQQIAQEAEIGYTVRQLLQIIRDPLFRLRLTQYNKKMDVAIIERATEEMTKFPEVELAKNKIAESAEKAAEVMLRLMNPRSNLSKKYPLAERRLMLSVAQDILDRVGMKTVSVGSEGSGSRREYSPEEIQSALSNAKELEAITQRLDQRGSSYVLSREQTDGSDNPAALADPVATAEEGLPIETTATSGVAGNPGAPS